jgi:hypothetical protein
MEHEYRFSTFDLDAPVGELTTNGHQQSLAVPAQGWQADIA